MWRVCFTCFQHVPFFGSNGTGSPFFGSNGTCSPFFAFAPSNPIFGSAGGVGPGPPRTANSTALGILLYWLREVLELTVL